MSEVFYMSDELQKKADEDFSKMFEMRPAKKHVIQLKDIELDVNRYQRNFMSTPRIKWFLDPETGKYRTSYMFSGFDDSQNNEDLPEIFQPYLQYVNAQFPDCKFNQVSVNWYTDGNDHISFHRDCEEYMAGNKKVVILTLNEKPENPRFMTFKDPVSGEMFQVELTHGSLVVLTPEFQAKFKHGIRKMEGGKKRISLSFRQYLEN